MSNENPWLAMPESSKRRISEQTQRDLFWVTDLHGNYGFYIRSAERFTETNLSINLRRINILKRNSSDDRGELFLVLIDRNDWQLFKVVCEDLVAEALKAESDSLMILAVENRLSRWQRLLKQDVTPELTIQVQMGLFSELLCLRDLIAPKTGLHQAIKSWVGPEKDRQDFLLGRSAVEVKSFRSSKGSFVEVSSAYQLFSEKESLYLISFGLTRSEIGETIKDVVEGIETDITANHPTILPEFESKLELYGYVPELLKQPLVPFIVDSKRIYIVERDFPKILPTDVPDQVVSVKYVLDLTRCLDFETTFSEVNF